MSFSYQHWQSDSKSGLQDSGLQDFSRYSGQFQQYCILNSFDSSSDLQHFSFFSKSLVTVPSALIIRGITVTLMFHSFLSSLPRSKYFSFCFRWFSFSGPLVSQSLLYNNISFLFVNYPYLPNPSTGAGYDTRSIFKAEFNRFEFRVFLLLD